MHTKLCAFMQSARSFLELLCSKRSISLFPKIVEILSPSLCVSAVFIHININMANEGPTTYTCPTHQRVGGPGFHMLMRYFPPFV